MKQDIVKSCVNFAHILAKSCLGAYVGHDALNLLSRLESIVEFNSESKGNRLQLGSNIGGASDKLRDQKKKEKRDSATHHPKIKEYVRFLIS